MSKQIEAVADDSVAKLLGSDLCLQDRASILLGLDSGLRLGEVVDIDVSSLQRHKQSTECESNQIYTSVLVNGLYRDRDVPISGRTSSVLVEYLKDRIGTEDAPLFRTPTGTRLSKRAFHIRFNTLCKKNELTGICFHSLRRIFVDQLVAAGPHGSSRKTVRKYSNQSRTKYVQVLGETVRLEYLRALLRISRRIAMESKVAVLKSNDSSSS